MTTAPAPKPSPFATKLPGGFELRWPSVVVLAIALSFIAFIWHTSSPDERLQILAALVPVALVAQALMRRVIGLQAPEGGAGGASGGSSDGPSTRSQRRTMPPPPDRIERWALASAALFALCLTGCGAGTMTTLGAIGAAVKPVGTMLCLAARTTTNVCERVGAYGPTSAPATTAGGEVPACAPTVAELVEAPSEQP